MRERRIDEALAGLPPSKKRTELKWLLGSLSSSARNPNSPDGAKIQLSEVEHTILNFGEKKVRRPKTRRPSVRFRCATEDPKCPLRPGDSISVGFTSSGMGEFVSIPTGKQTFVSIDDWNEEEKIRIARDWDHDANSRPSGSYGAVGYRDDGAFFDYRDQGTLWKPGTFKLSSDQRFFVKKSKRGHATEKEAVDSCVFPYHNYASRFVSQGYLLVITNKYAVAFVPGCSLSEWKRAQDD